MSAVVDHQQKFETLRRSHGTTRRMWEQICFNCKLSTGFNYAVATWDLN